MRLKILLFIRIFMLFTTNCVAFTIKNNGSGVHWHNCWVLITLNKRMALAHWHSVLLISLKPNSAAIIPYWLCNSCLLFIVGQLNRCQDHYSLLTFVWYPCAFTQWNPFAGLALFIYIKIDFLATTFVTLVISLLLVLLRL
jgi:hypothetical protein